jgi:hypothetical protein
VHLLTICSLTICALAHEDGVGVRHAHLDLSAINKLQHKEAENTWSHHMHQSVLSGKTNAVNAWQTNAVNA